MAIDSQEILRPHVKLPFERRAGLAGDWPITAGRTETLQLNLGYLCNQACSHCHHEAGPHRTELMSRDVMRAALKFADEAGIADFDLTGGAPELNPDFRWLVERLGERGASVIDRCNLTVLHDHRADGIERFLARRRIGIVASLPCYLEDNTDGQRGSGAFEASIEGLRKLNAVGYG
ncbi:MAG: radical SAM protein, partial [Armatimonadia bacterium]|nr:radical SAM protein [Armatimonadia bacterium]